MALLGRALLARTVCGTATLQGIRGQLGGLQPRYAAIARLPAGRWEEKRIASGGGETHHQYIRGSNKLAMRSIAVYFTHFPQQSSPLRAAALGQVVCRGPIATVWCCVSVLACARPRSLSPSPRMPMQSDRGLLAPAQQPRRAPHAQHGRAARHATWPVFVKFLTLPCKILDPPL